MKTSQEIAADIYWSSEFTTPLDGKGSEIRRVMAQAIEADRKQRAGALSALHEWAARVSFYADADDLNELVEIELRFGLVDEDGEPTT